VGIFSKATKKGALIKERTAYVMREIQLLYPGWQQDKIIAEFKKAMLLWGLTNMSEEAMHWYLVARGYRIEKDGAEFYAPEYWEKIKSGEIKDFTQCLSGEKIADFMEKF